MKKLKGMHLYPEHGEPPCPHTAFVAWSKSIGCKLHETPKGFGKMKKPIPKGMDFLLLESLYCLPSAADYKNKNPDCRIIAIIADTSFLQERLSLLRRLYYWLYLDNVDAFIPQSKRIADDIKRYYGCCDYGMCPIPIFVCRPFFVNKCEPKRNKEYCNGLLFIGNAVKEKGSREAADAMEFLPDFRLKLVGSCAPEGMYRASKNSDIINVFAFGKVPSLKPHFDDATYLLHPSSFDPSPVVVWEAMYAGLLPIITRDVGQAELFKDKLQVLLLDDNKPETIAKKVKELHALPKKEKDELRRLCRKLVLQYTEEKSINKFKEVFDAVWKCII